MSARNRRSEATRSEIERLVDLERPGRPGATPQPVDDGAPPPPGAIIGVDDVRAPLNDPRSGTYRIRRWRSAERPARA
jgi:hypothetical protein